MAKRPDLSNNDAALDVARQALRRTEDETALVLRAHLVVEAFLWRVLERNVSNPAVLAESRLSFRQLVSVVGSLCGNRQYDWLWVTLERLNALRNELAHSLTTPDYKKKRQAFIDSVGFHITTPKDLDPAEDFRFVLIILSGVVFNVPMKTQAERTDSSSM